ncbi:hypothetical protein [Pseudofrankia asymbiotica]|nr:hypothetical protein [Pseudofrankia asymbiotica]
MNLIVADKQRHQRYLSAAQAAEHCAQGEYFEDLPEIQDWTRPAGQ